jgi:hypothetical protein
MDSGIVLLYCFLVLYFYLLFFGNRAEPMNFDDEL